MRLVVWHLFFLRSKPISHSKSLHKRICKIHEKDKIFSLPVQRVQICKRVFLLCVWVVSTLRYICTYIVVLIYLPTKLVKFCTYWSRRFMNRKKIPSKNKDISWCNIWKIWEEKREQLSCSRHAFTNFWVFEVLENICRRKQIRNFVNSWNYDMNSSGNLFENILML